jgi:hypothetical protein
MDGGFIAKRKKRRGFSPYEAKPVTLEFRNIQGFADFPGEMLVDLVVARNRRTSIFARIPPPGMISTLPDQHTPMFG